MCLPLSGRQCGLSGATAGGRGGGQLRYSPICASQLQCIQPQCKRGKARLPWLPPGYLMRVKFKSIWRLWKRSLLCQFGDYPSKPGWFLSGPSLAGAWGSSLLVFGDSPWPQWGVERVGQACVGWAGLAGTVGGYEEEIWSLWVFSAHYLLIIIQWHIYLLAFILILIR